VSERWIQSRVAPHLVQPMRFLVPIYRGSKPSLELMNIGLWIYDALSLFRAPKLHKTYRGKAAQGLCREISHENLRGCIEYYDYVTDDARLVLENILDAKGNGALCRSYHKVTKIERTRA